MLTPASPGVASHRPRVALYGHDTAGLGHLRRNLSLAAAMVGGADDPAPDVLVLSGSPAAGRFPRPAGVDLVVLPEVGKLPPGQYRPGSLRCGLGAVLGLRSAVLQAALRAWAPDLLVVDKVPLGLGGELAPALLELRQGGRTTTVLGLRDVLDDPVRARLEWRRDGGDRAVRELYSEVWVYGDPAVHDLTDDLAMAPDVRRRTRFTGYLAAGRTAPPRHPDGVPPGRRTVLGLVGGGEDGAGLARAFAAAPVPAGCTAVLVCGPYLPPAEQARLQAVAAGRDDLLVVPFAPDPTGWAAGAAAVVTMGGYNTVGELLATGTPTLVVPRVAPRREQLVRARSLADAGAVDLLIPEHATPEALGRWLTGAVAGPRRSRDGLDLGGLGWVARRSHRLLRRADRLAPHTLEAHTLEDRRAAV